VAYIPPDAKWYIAEIVEEFTFEHEPENIVHTNMVLIRADSPDEAYEHAMTLGKAGDQSYLNTDGITVTVKFRGLRSLSVVHGDLEHGTELMWDQSKGMSEQDLANWVVPKARLSVFRPIRDLSETVGYD
jgi:hypothetical protein